MEGQQKHVSISSTPEVTTAMVGLSRLSLGAVVTNLLLNEQVHAPEINHNGQAREMELLKSELLATVGHELRSPLASIKGYAATLLRHEQRISREERHEFLLAINEGSDRLAVVIDRLLEMSQLETGTITIKRSPVNIVHLVHEAINAISQRVEERELADEDYRRPVDTTESDGPGRISIALRLEDELGAPADDEPIILADRFRLREALDNLLQNAILYSPEGGVIEVILCPTSAEDSLRRVQALTRNREKKNVPDEGLKLSYEQRMLEIRVRDNGIGIPEEHLERIFDHFHRVDTRLTREVNGLGLGLAITKRIVELHNGVIWAESKPGEGSTFHIWLPLEE